MIRLPGAVVLALAAAAVATPAVAQYNSSPAPYYRSASPDAGAPNLILPYPDEADQADEAPLPPPPFVRGRAFDAPDADEEVVRPPGHVRGAAPAGPAATPEPVPPAATAALPPEDQPETGNPKELPPNLRRQLVDFPTREPAGTIIIDTPNTYLYLVLGRGQAIRYGIGVGREGFTWAGTERISKMKEWPDWFPPKEMIERQPYLPRMMAGGPGNPLGARALYLGHTLYRIHGTNQPSTIGKFVSSGCIRLLNADIEDLYSRVQVGSHVVVMPGKAPEAVSSADEEAPGNGTAAPPPAYGAANTSAVSGSRLPPLR
jgi:lipoprotein-anchoring transpeptidase ErfK/SrfK